MTDIPPLEPAAAAHRRHWIEYAATGAALLISAISLWVAVNTMDANNKMVAAASWPYLEISTSDGLPDGSDVLTFDVINAGVGPALVRTFEVQLDGRPIRSAGDLLTKCCGYNPKKPRPMSLYQPEIGGWTEGSITSTVIRAGESRTLFRYARTDKNTSAWMFLKKAVAGRRLIARACWCSVFNECWQSSFTGGIDVEHVDQCKKPEVPYG